VNNEMPDLVPPVDDAQRLVLETLHRVFRETCEWPRYQYVASVLDAEQDVDLQRVLESMPPGLYWPRNAGGVVWHSDDEILGLRVRGLACCRDAESDIACLLACVRFVVATRREAKPASPQAVVEPTLRFADFIKPIESVVGPNPELYRVVLVLELMKAEPFLPSWEGSLDDPAQRHVRLSRDVLRFRDVETLNDLLVAIPEESQPPIARLPTTPVEPHYADVPPASSSLPNAQPQLASSASDYARGADDERTDVPAEAALEDPLRSRRPVIASLLAFFVIVALGVWFAVSPGRTSGGVAIIAGGLVLAVGIAAALGPKATESAAVIGLATLALGAISGGAAVLAAGGDGVPELSGTSTTTTTTASTLDPPPHKATPGLPRSGPTLAVWNKVTNGAQSMRDDDAHPAYLSTAPRAFCKDARCAIPGTDVSTRDTVGPAICQRKGAEITNGDNSSNVDDENAGLYTSDVWYGIRRPDDTIGYISDVWVRPSQRGGLGLPDCRRP
jgi:hypothetical protein